MNDTSCEKVLIAKMAEADGERAEVSTSEIERHLGACEQCRAEVARLQKIDRTLQQASRAEQPVDLWPAIGGKLGRIAPRIGWRPFAVAAVLLLVFKLLEMLPEQDPGLVVKVVPLIIFASLILFLKENPFRINSELVLEK